jgi:hypothetical protein
MAKATRSPPVQLGFAGLCKTFSMSSKEVDGFANLCSSLAKMNHVGPSAFSVLDPVTGELLEHILFPRGEKSTNTTTTMHH